MKQQTPEEMWIEYRDACYKGKDIHVIQEAETRQAFYAGLLAAATAFAKNATESADEEEGARRIGAFMAQVTRAIHERLFQLKSKQ